MPARSPRCPHPGLHNNRDPAQVRQAFAGIETTWQHLRGQLARASSPAVNRAAGRVDQLDAQIRQALGLNAPPAGFYGQGQAPTGIADTQRLSRNMRLAEEPGRRTADPERKAALLIRGRFGAA